LRLVYGLWVPTRGSVRNATADCGDGSRAGDVDVDGVRCAGARWRTRG
jgi:hypothetical protein